MPTDHTDLQGRRVDAVRAWTAFVEHGDGAEALVRPEILRSWQRSGAAVTSDVTEAPLADESETAAVLAAAPRCRPRSSGSRPSCGVRPRTATSSIAVTDAETRILWTYGGRVMRRKAETRQLRGRWPLGRRERRHQRPRPGQPRRRAVDGVQRRALRLDRAQLGLLGRAGARPGHRRAARRDRPVDDLGPHPPDRAGDRAGDGPADRDRDARLEQPPRHSRGESPTTGRACPAPCSAPPRPGSTASGCCSTGGRPRSSPCSRCTPRGCRSSTCTRCSTATRRSRFPRSRPRSPTCARRSAASSRRAPTG